MSGEQPFEGWAIVELMGHNRLCPNLAHAARKAAVRVSWPAGRFRPVTACRSCMRYHLAVALEEGIAILIEPMTPP